MTEFLPTIGALGLNLSQFLLNELISLFFGLDVGVLSFEFCDEDLEIGNLFLERFVGAEVVMDIFSTYIVTFDGCDLNLIKLKGDRETILVELIPELTPTSRR